jgi:AhpD family alkylhydroperoxidase
LIALAVSATNGCTYCIRSHTAAARKLGMDDQMLGELMGVVGVFNQTNRLADGYQVEVDHQIMAASEGQAASPATAMSAALRKTRAANRKAQRAPRARGRAAHRG